MLKKSSRHVLGFIVAALIASVAAAQPVPAAAPTNGTLFGVVGCQLDCHPFVDRLDPTSGAETPFVDLGQVGAGSLVADPVDHRLYSAGATVGGGKGGGGGNSVIFTVDTQAGVVTTSPDLSVFPLDMVLDPANHTLLALSNSNSSISVVRLDPATWIATPLATLAEGARGLAYDPTSRILYTQTNDFTVFPPTGRLFAINTQTGAVSAGTSLNPAVFNLVFDTSSRALYGEAGSFPNRFVQVNPSTGAVTPVGSFTFPAGFATAVTVDSGTHTVFFVETEVVLGGARATWIATVNDQTGASTLSPQTAQPVRGIAFQPPPITAESIQSDVRLALASGAIDNPGVANSLLAKLNAAADARSRGNCNTAANVYASFVNDLSAQSAKHVATTTATQLTAEAQFLIANCP